MARPCCSRAAAIRPCRSTTLALGVGKLGLRHDVLGGQRRQPVDIFLRQARLRDRELIVAAASAPSRRRCSADERSAATRLDSAWRRTAGSKVSLRRPGPKTMYPCPAAESRADRASNASVSAWIWRLCGLSSRASDWPFLSRWPDRTSSSATIVRAIDARAPTEMRRLRPRRYSAKPASASSISASTVSALRSRYRPASLRTSWLLIRSNSCPPSAFSSLPSCCDRAGWVTPSCLAARVSDSLCATAQNTRSWLSVIIGNQRNHDGALSSGSLRFSLRRRYTVPIC